jgi:hypothetical protein
MNLLTYFPNLTKMALSQRDSYPRANTPSHPTGEDGVTLPSIYLNVFPSLRDIDASFFVRPSLHLHSSLRWLEAKM